MIAYDRPTTRDRAELAAMAERSFVETFGTLYAPADLATFVGEAFGPAGLPAQIDNPAYRLRVARAAGSIVGFAKLGPLALPAPAPAPGAVELCQLYVLAAHHGTGIAQALMDWAMAEARAGGAPELYLSVFADNRRAQRFYARYGFAEVGRYAFKVGTQLDDDRIWRCAL